MIQFQYNNTKEALNKAQLQLIDLSTIILTLYSLFLTSFIMKSILKFSYVQAI